MKEELIKDSILNKILNIPYTIIYLFSGWEHIHYFLAGWKWEKSNLNINNRIKEIREDYEI